MAPVEGNETIDSGSTHQEGRAGRGLVATRRLRHPGAELVDLSRQLEDDGIQFLSGDVLAGSTINSIFYSISGVGTVGFLVSRAEPCSSGTWRDSSVRGREGGVVGDFQ
jgi:hypothetical protein